MPKRVQRITIVAVAVLLAVAALFVATEMARPRGPPADALVLVETIDGHQFQLDPARAAQITAVMRRRASFSFGDNDLMPDGSLLIDGRTYFWRGSIIIEGSESHRHWYWHDDRVGEVLHEALGKK